MSDRVSLPRAAARRVAFITALEEADRDGAWLPSEDRERATRSARAALGESPSEEALAAAVAGRAEELWSVATGHEPRLREFDRTLPRGSFIVALLVPLIVLGIGQSILGGDRVIDLFANPLVALILWNSIAAVIGIVRALIPSPPPAPLAAEAVDGDRGGTASPLAARLGEWWLRVGGRTKDLDAADRTALAARVTAGFARRWEAIGRRQRAASITAQLHLVAILLLAIAIGEAYARGLFTEYQVGWQSTWLDPAQAQQLAELIYGLPAQLLGTPLELPSAPEPAAPWIHRMALAAVLFGLLPRLLLVTLTVARRPSPALIVPISPTLARRLQARTQTAFSQVRVTPYCVRLNPSQSDRLRGWLVELLGERAVIKIGDPVDYGDDPPETTDGETADLCRVVLFGLAQPPESEVHAAFVSDLSDRSVPAIALVDASSLRRRFGNDPAGDARIAERRRAWDRVLSAGSHRFAHIDLSADLGDLEYTQLREALTAAREGSPR